jgi:hypothetical protein
MKAAHAGSTSAPHEYLIEVKKTPLIDFSRQKHALDQWGDIFLMVLCVINLAKDAGRPGI